MQFIEKYSNIDIKEIKECIKNIRVGLDNIYVDNPSNYILRSSYVIFINNIENSIIALNNDLIKYKEQFDFLYSKLGNVNIPDNNNNIQPYISVITEIRKMKNLIIIAEQIEKNKHIKGIISATDFIMFLDSLSLMKDSLEDIYIYENEIYSQYKEVSVVVENTKHYLKNKFDIYKQFQTKWKNV